MLRDSKKYSLAQVSHWTEKQVSTGKKSVYKELEIKFEDGSKQGNDSIIVPGGVRVFGKNPHIHSEHNKSNYQEEDKRCNRACLGL